jgi:asparagine synthase (glutamine-hydrolysing)
MSGILCVFRRDGRGVQPDTLQPAVDALAHRGPDGRGTWARASVLLAHHQLCTTPEARHEKQPLHTDAGGDVVLAADARIDNRNELVRALGLDDASGRVITDADLILAAYLRWGCDCAEHLIGAFAFALWDGRRRQVVCARDPVGVRPLYYYASSQLFACASEIRALHRIESIPCQPNERQIARFLTGQDQRGENATFYAAIERLPAASCLRVTADRLDVERYWQVDPNRELSLGSDEAYAEAFQARFEKAVRARMRSTRPLSIRLSGGLDSSSVACTMRRRCREDGPDPIKTFTYVYPDVPEPVAALMDERPYVEDVLAQGGFEPHVLKADRLSPVDKLDDVIACIEQPHAIDNLYAVWAVFALIAQHDTRAVLDGSEGDVTVTHGHAHLRWLARTGQWAELAQHAQARKTHLEPARPDIDPATTLYTYGSHYFRGLAASGRWIRFANEIMRASAHFDVSPWQLARDHHLKQLVPGPLRALLQTNASAPVSAVPDTVIHPGFAARLGIHSETTAQDRSTRPVPQRHAHAATFNRGLLAPVQEIFDKIAARHGLTHRHPFWDRRLIEFCVALPPEQIVRNGWGRWILRRAMDGILPPSIQWRTDKGNLGPNFVMNLRAMGEPAVDTMMQRSRAVWDYVDRAQVKTTQAVLRGETGYTVQGVRAARTLMRVLALDAWLQNQDF